MSLTQILPALPNRDSQSNQAWANAEEERGRKVLMFRDYVDGDHTDNTNQAQKHLLNQGSKKSEASHPFNVNTCPVIIDTMLDRIHLTDIRASAEADTESETQNKWIEKYLQRNRFDALQIDVTDATVRDGNSYLMCYPDPETGEARWSAEPAYDGNFGTVLRYETTASKDPLYAVKTWKTSSTEVADTIRVNVYYPDRIERFVSDGTTTLGAAALKPFSGDNEPEVIPWVDAAGEPLGVPFVHYRNRGSSADNFGLSELENVIPLQDLLNTVSTSGAATALLQGFPIRAVIGGVAPAAVTPGLTLNFYSQNALTGSVQEPSTTQIEWLNAIRLEQFESADLSQLIAFAEWVIGKIYAITNTPTDDIAADASGEARKQAVEKLLGKVKRFLTRNGNAWEDAVRMAARVDRAFNQTSEAPEVFEELDAMWDDPQVRNDSQTIADVIALFSAGVIPVEEARRELQSLKGWTDDDLERMKQEDEQARAQQMEDQANADDAAMVEGVLNGMKKKKLGEAVGGGDAQKQAA